MKNEFKKGKMIKQNEKMKIKNDQSGIIESRWYDREGHTTDDMNSGMKEWWDFPGKENGWERKRKFRWKMCWYIKKEKMKRWWIILIFKFYFLRKGML
jgi:uncharacterized protein YodC (DUF2158 family)